MVELVYNFDFKNSLTIIGNINKKIGWFLGEQWCEEKLNDKIVVNKDLNTIKYKINNDIPHFKDDRLYCYPMVRKEYACFTGVIGLYLPKVRDDNETIVVTYKTNFPLFISGIGKIDNKISFKSNLFMIKKQLYVLTKTFIELPNLILTYKWDSFFFISLEEIVKTVSKFIKNCYDFLEINEDVRFLINYVGYKVKGDVTGYGGNGNYAGFNYLITEKKKTPELTDRVKLYLLHELYHHFNTSSDYESNWFNEGFTEFFCRWLSMSKDEFKKEVNMFLIDYMLNPYRNSRISIMTKHNFWTNKFIEKLPYKKGFVYALYLYQTYGDGFLEKYKKIIKRMHKPQYIELKNNDLKKMLNDNNFDDYIINGKTIKIRTDHLIKKRSVNIGFDIGKAINQKVIGNLDKESEAYKRGVREGKIDGLEINTTEWTIVILKSDHKITFDLCTGPYIKIPQI